MMDKNNTAIIISADIRDFGYRFLALQNVIKIYKENYNIFIVLVLRGLDHDFDVDLQINEKHLTLFTKEKDWNAAIDELPESIKYVFFSDADCIEAPDKKPLLNTAIEELERNNLDGLHCFSDILYLSEYATQIFHCKETLGNIINDFEHQKSGSNGGVASGGLLLFKKDWIKKVRFIDYCWLGAGDTVNLTMFMPITIDDKFSEIWNEELIEDIEERRRNSNGIRFGRLNATIIHLFHRSVDLNLNKFKRMFYGIVSKPNLDLNEELGDPHIEYLEQIEMCKKHIYKGMKIIDLINLAYALGESDNELKFPFLKHNKYINTVVLTDTYPFKICEKQG